MPPLSKPHAAWKPKLNKKERESTWAKAAGDGKSPRQHQTARATFTRTANEDAALKKNGIGLTADDNTVLKKRQVRLSRKKSRKWRLAGESGISRKKQRSASCLAGDTGKPRQNKRNAARQSGDTGKPRQTKRK